MLQADIRVIMKRYMNYVRKYETNLIDVSNRNFVSFRPFLNRLVVFLLVYAVQPLHFLIPVHRIIYQTHYLVRRDYYPALAYIENS